MSDYEVIAGYIGTVYSGTSEADARAQFDAYVKHSKDGCGRVAGEPVYLMKDGEPIAEYQSASQEAEE